MFKYLNEFEETISEYFDSKYAVAVDSCTHAIELCLRLTEVRNTGCPKHTYLSVPMTFEKLQLNWVWSQYQWKNKYFLRNTNIVDAAVLWKKNSYIKGTLTCVSFQFKKHLNIGRGGMILLDDKLAYEELIKMSYDGRARGAAWADQNVSTLGYHYYMTPESAIRGLEKFPLVKNITPTIWSWKNYPDLSELEVFNNVKQK